MAYQVRALHLKPCLSILENEVSEVSYITLATYAVLRWSRKPNLSGATSRIGLKSASYPKTRMQSFITMVNYWKAGVCLGLFVDAFKLGS
ncbi:hypothetical protein SLEP1_g37036 [Rubroshorea leprosula]|uniref:Uncharacterized protein n=1 Tax=Rubroshorea leprosula TaxID=152421 RepID=A0AAV5KTW6_9ROSI|nr:hypothetical protein SLEP1_g37036 [Rubroshorea leprosula]